MELTQNLEKKFQKNMQLFRAYMDSESAQTKEQEKMIDRLKSTENILLSDSTDIPLAQFVSDESDLSRNALDIYEKSVLDSMKDGKKNLV